MKKSWILLLFIGFTALRAQPLNTAKQKVTLMNYYLYDANMNQGYDDLLIAKWFGVMNDVVAKEKGKTAPISVYTAFNSLHNFVINKIIRLPKFDSAHYYQLFSDFPSPLTEDSTSTLYLNTYRWAQTQKKEDLNKIQFLTYSYSFSEQKSHRWLDYDPINNSEWVAALLYNLKPYESNPKIQMYSNALLAHLNFKKFENNFEFDGNNYSKKDNNEESVRRYISGEIEYDMKLFVADLPGLRKQLGVDTFTGNKLMDWNFMERFIFALNENYNIPVSGQLNALKEIVNYPDKVLSKIDKGSNAYVLFDAATFWDSSLTALKSDSAHNLYLGDFNPMFPIAAEINQVKLWKMISPSKIDLELVFYYDTNYTTDSKKLLDTVVMRKLLTLSKTKNIKVVQLNLVNVVKPLGLDSVLRVSDYSSSDLEIQEVYDSTVSVDDEDVNAGNRFSYGYNFFLTGGYKNVWLKQENLESDFRTQNMFGLSGMQFATLELNMLSRNYSIGSEKLFSIFTNVALSNKANSKLSIHQFGIGFTQVFEKRFYSFNMIQKFGVSVDNLTIGNYQQGSILAPTTLNHYSKYDGFGQIGYEFNFGIKFIRIGIQGGYQFDFTNGEWKLNDVNIPYQQKLLHTGFYSNITCMIKLF